MSLDDLAGPVKKMAIPQVTTRKTNQPTYTTTDYSGGL